MKVIVEADGGSRGNPGPAGFGCVVWAEDLTTLLAEHGQAIGVTTNNVAEYRGLIAGLELARRVEALTIRASILEARASEIPELHQSLLPVGVRRAAARATCRRRAFPQHLAHEIRWHLCGRTCRTRTVQRGH